MAVRLGLDSGCHRLLETPLVINGAIGTVALSFNVGDAAAGGLAEAGGAGQMTWQGTGATPTYALPSPLLGAADAACKFAGDATSGLMLGGPSAAFGDITTEDFYVEAFVVSGFVGAAVGIVSKRSALALTGAPVSGWAFEIGSDYNIYGLVQATPVAQTYDVSAATLAMGGCDYYSWAVNRDEASVSGSRIYRNGAAISNGKDMSAHVGSLTNPNVFMIGASGYYSTRTYPERIMFVSFHARAAWMQAGAAGPAEWLEVHKKRFALLTASRPAFSVVPSTYPSSAGSTSPVYSPKVTAGVEQIFLMGAGAPTFGRILDANGSAVVVHQVEAAAKSVLLQSQTLGTTWAKLDAGDTIGANAALGPDGSLTLESIIADSTDGLHGVSQASSENLTAAVWVLSGYHTIGTLGWLYVDNTTVANCTAYFNVTTGAVGTLGAAVVGAGIKAIGTGRVRWWIAFTGTVALHTVRVAVAQADGDNSIVGDGAAVQGYAGCMQLSAGDYPHSYIITTTAAVTCAASSLKYSIANCFPRSEGTVLFGLIGESFTPARARVLMSLDDGSANNRLEVGTAATTGAVSALGRKAAGTDGDAALAGSVFDLLRRPGMLSWREGELSIWLKSAGVWSVARDATFTPPAGATLTTLCVGHDNAIANHAGSGLYSLSGIYLLPNYYPDPSAVRCGSDNLWSRDYY